MWRFGVLPWNCSMKYRTKYARSPFPFTFYLVHQRLVGILPTAASWEQGGYEVETVSSFTSSAEIET